MKTLFFTLLYLYGMNFSAVAQNQKTASINTTPEDETYYFFCECLINNDGRVVSWVYFEPIPIKKSKSTNFAFDSYKRYKDYILPKKDENINGIAEIFDKEYGFDNIAAGKSVRDSRCDVFASLESAKMYYRDRLRYAKQGRDYTVGWQPPVEYTGLQPINAVPIIKPYIFTSDLEPIYSTYAETTTGKPVESNPKNPKPDKPKPTSTTPPKPSQGSITVEKKDTKFQEAEAKRILDAKKAEQQREVKLQAIKNQAQAEDKKRIQELNEAMKKRGRRQ